MLVHTLSSSFSFDDEIIEDYAPSDSSFAFAAAGGGQATVNSSSHDLSNHTQNNSTITTNIVAKNDQENQKNLQLKSNILSLPNNSLHFLSSFDAKLSEEFNADNSQKSVKCKNYIRWLEKKV